MPLMAGARRPVDIQQLGDVLGEVWIVGQHHRNRLAHDSRGEL
jgi:hypothetical protein